MRRRLRIEGMVQGVGYRFFAARAARRLGVRGWVRNLRDGAVEALGEGDEATLRAWIEDLRRGPRGGSVIRLEEEVVAAGEELTTFEIRW